jgi:hypothetical protein
MLNHGYIAFAIIEVRGDSAEEISTRMAVVGKIAGEHNLVTDAFVSGLIIISRGTVPDAASGRSPEPFSILLLKILTELKDNVRIVSGHEFADFGKIGDQSRFAYTFIAPSFAKALSRLLATPFGKIADVT